MNAPTALNYPADPAYVAVRTAKGTVHLVTHYATKGHGTDVAVTACNAWLSPSILAECDAESINDLGACRLCYKLWKEQTL